MEHWDNAPWMTNRQHFHPGDDVWERSAQAAKDEAAYLYWVAWNAYVAKHAFDGDVSHETKLYVVGPEDGSRFKIGVSAQPYHRLSNLAVGAGVRLKLLAAVPAKRSFEKYLHGLLAPYKVFGEWYEGSPRVLAVANFLVGIEQGCFDMEGADDGFVPLFADALEWLWSVPMEAIAHTERELRAALDDPPPGYRAGV